MMTELIADMIQELRGTPGRASRLCHSMPVAKLRRKPAADLFAAIEDAWHLRDIECEGHEVRVRRILSETCPALDSIDGDRLAVERRYLERELETTLDEFARARERSLRMLESAAASDWNRTAVFEGRTLTLLDYVRSMVEHDRAHLSSLEGVYVSSRAA